MIILGRCAAVTLTGAVILIGAAGPVRAQSTEAPSEAPVQVGPLALSPSIGLTNVGYDSNVYNRSVNDDPRGDVTAKLSPVIEASVRLPHARVTERSEFDFYYFKQLTGLRALDTDTAVRVELPVNRLTPFFAGALTDTRQSQNLEIDAIARRRIDGVTAGLSLRLTGKVSAEAYAQRSQVEYAANSLYLGSDLAHELNYISVGEGMALRYALTPFTTFAVAVERQKDRFEFVADRDSINLLVTPSVEFNPLALVSGRASFGFQRRTFLTAGVPAFNGSTAFADLHYTLLGRTRFTVEAHRELRYTYIVGLSDYVETAVSTSVTQRLGESWDIGATLGRARLAYTQQSTPTSLMTPNSSDETVPTYGVDVGYNLGRARVGCHFDYRSRETDLPVPFRTYRRFRIGSTLTYAF